MVSDVTAPVTIGHFAQATMESQCGQRGVLVVAGLDRPQLPLGVSLRRPIAKTGAGSRITSADTTSSFCFTRQ